MLQPCAAVDSMKEYHCFEFAGLWVANHAVIPLFCVYFPASNNPTFRMKTTLMTKLVTVKCPCVRTCSGKLEASN